jgi:FixJ family two-component response regulator
MPHWRGCVIVDIRMPGMSGLDMQSALAGHPSRLPVIIITGHGDVAAARQALKAHAVDFLEKPLDDDRLVQAIENALRGLPMNMTAGEGPGTRPRSATLSAREREVMALVVEGLDNRSLGARLGISPRTVEVHKSRVMTKLGARNLAELIRIAQAGGGTT